ncbi:MAG: outer membrane beta-barrel protein [Ignavibacteriaceae bacterium]|nr:outer membrane beta-barrel protein [Ignavibacteriaceae bacterium]
MKKIFSILVVLFVAFTVGVNAQSKMGASIQGGIALPMGTFGDVYGMGFGGMGTFTYSISPMTDITGSVGYLMWNGKDAFEDWTFSSVPVLVGARYYFSPGNVRPYGVAQAGMHFVSSEAEISFLGTTTTVSASDSFFGFGAGAGVVVPIGKKVNLDVNAMFNSISSEGDASNYVSVLAGVMFGF